MVSRVRLPTTARRRKINCSVNIEHRCFSKLSGSPQSIDDPVSNTDLRDKILKAPFERVDKIKPLFPWIHSTEPLDRLIPGTQDYFRKGNLLGAGLTSSNPKMDTLATALLFLDVPWYKFLFFKQWKRDLAEDMSWAFSQGVAGILSNVYRLPFDTVVIDDSSLAFNHSLSSQTGENDNNNNSSFVADDDLGYMVQSSLRSLYESASQCGKDQIQVRLECKPTGDAKLVNLFVFPFLSRRAMKGSPGLKGKYEELLNLMTVSAQSALPVYQELIQDFLHGGHVDSTVICQVLVECDEIFWVKDLNTGLTIQGYEDGKIRKVWHLVRFECVVETFPKQEGFLPFQHKQGNWQITDIDDILDGNLII